MWVVPGATLRHITNVSQGVRDKTLGLILHVQVGNGELTGWYDNPGSQASSAWQAMKSGTVFQFGDPDADKFWTQGAGNPDYGAVETEGYPTEPLTDAQVDAVARIYAKGHLEEGWPFQLAEKPGDRGLGWHGMGGKAWGNHPNCPGEIRKNQRPEILRRARLIVQGDDDMPDEATFKKWVQEAVWTQPSDVAGRSMWRRLTDACGALSKASLQTAVWTQQGATPGRSMWATITGMEATLAAQSAALQQLAKAQGQDPAKVEQIIADAVAKALADIRLVPATEVPTTQE